MTNRDPSQFMELATGFWRAKIFLSAMELELFTLLGGTAMTGREIREGVGLHNRAVPDFLDALVALQVLDRDGEGPEATYRNSEDGAHFLDKNRESYIGGFFEMLNAVSTGSGGTSPRPCRRDDPKTKSSTRERRCSRSCTGIPLASSSS